MIKSKHIFSWTVRLCFLLFLSPSYVAYITVETSTNSIYQCNSPKMVSEEANGNLRNMVSEEANDNSTPPWIYEAYEKLKGHHIVFIGDSLTRFQYMSLALALHRGVPVRQSESPNPLAAHTWDIYSKEYDDWTNFEMHSSDLMAPNEYCDCYRKGNIDLKEVFENRYYVNESNFFLTYLGCFASNSRGHWQQGLDDNLRRPHLTPSPPLWDWDPVTSLGENNTLVNHLQRLIPKPTVIIINEGHWGHSWHEREWALKRGLNELSHITPHLFWKTTTYKSANYPTEMGGRGEFYHHRETDEKICKYPEFEGCFNLSWTRHCSPSSYYEGLHFLPFVYDVMSQQLLAILDQLKTNSTMQMSH